MRRQKLVALADKGDSEIKSCTLIERCDDYVRFTVDEGLASPRCHFETVDNDGLIDSMLKAEQIEPSLRNIVTFSWSSQNISSVGADVMWQTFITCFAEHRPLVLSPDMIWLLISQTIAGHVRRNSERLRRKFVDFNGQMDLCITTYDDLESEELDWTSLFSQFYDQINEHAKLTSGLLNDFSTTGSVEKLASTATFMGMVESYFRFHVFDCICGIPEVTLLGTTEDWESVLEKSQILPKLGLKSWYSWLEPIIKEFIRTSKGIPNIEFWKSIVLDSRREDLFMNRGCLPNNQKINGWCIVFFPFSDGQKLSLDTRFVTSKMDSEMLRVGFQYHKLKPGIGFDTTHMELWAGFIGVEENKNTFALTPQIGWFARKSEPDKESLARLKEQDEMCGINLRIKEVPSQLLGLGQIRSLTLDFIGKIDIPVWMDDIQIENFTVSGVVTPAEKKDLQRRFKNIRIYPEPNEE